MLKEINLKQKADKKEYKKLFNDMCLKIGLLQRRARELNIPVMISFDGWSASGKGEQINKLIRGLDPRGFEVFSIQKETEEEKHHPFMWRFWTKTPEKGRIAIFDRSWYLSVMRDRKDERVDISYEEIMSFEKLLVDDNNLLIKFFLHISKEEQKKRLKKISSSKDTAWLVNDDDLKQNKNYSRYLKYFDEAITSTDSSYAPWTVIEANNSDYASLKVMHTVISALEKKIEEAQTHKKKNINSSISSNTYNASVIDGVDLSKKLEHNEYKLRLDKAQKKLFDLQNKAYQERVAAVCLFEGWDASGKGGVIKRLTQKLDPRGYCVFPSAAPTDEQKAHNYLWRYWSHVPKDGHFGIFDRSWYGRVMVERIEGFCSENEWRRAYHEINDFEKSMANQGTVICKFWLQIDKDEQEKRFNERKENPYKSWKLTDEDWRNRDKWDDYTTAVNEMILKTSTTYAPWTVVEANDKYYARVKVLETVVEALERHLK